MKERGLETGHEAYRMGDFKCHAQEFRLCVSTMRQLNEINEGSDLICVINR